MPCIQDGDHQRTQSLRHRLVLRETAIGRKDRGENLHLWQRPTGGAGGVLPAQESFQGGAKDAEGT